MDDQPGLDLAAAPDTAALVRWLVREGREIADTRALLEATCRTIVDAGLPLWRASLHIRNLHPEVAATTYEWRRDRGAKAILRYHGVQLQPGFLNSPIYWIYNGAAGLRRRLEGAEATLDFPILPELKDEGATDYVAMGVPFTSGVNNAVTWATDRPGGFTTDELAILDDILPHLALILEVQTTRRIGETLLTVYLGADAGQRVLKGQVTRGSGETIEAAILFSDMRDFTPLAATLPPAATIDLLNQYFECVTAPVEDYGGQVLKFMGDGLLAIFPLNAGGARPACKAALAASQSVFANLAELNRKRAEAPVRIGITLHVGQVVYGNIGSTNRLDFTVIGAAVNLVSRLQTLCKTLNRTLLMSADFARDSGAPALPLGAYTLRGVAAPQEVFGLAGDPRPVDSL